MQKKRKIVLAILFIFCFNFLNIKASETTTEITLKPTEQEKDFNFHVDENSDFIYITGEIDKSKKYILISLKSDGKNPSISITKNQNFDIYKDEYDYTLLPQENKLVLPSPYFEADKVTGFYMIISWENKNNDIILNFKYLDKINLEIGEQFSFFTKNEIVENFQIEIKNENSNFGNIGFIISGGDEKQLSMNVNGNKAKKMLNNVFAYWVNNDSDKYLININVSENVKFIFTSQIFGREEGNIHNKDLENNLYNQFYFIKNNREECFNLKLNEGENERDLIVLSQENFSIDLYMDEQSSSLIHYDYIFQNSELYAISDNLKLNNTINKICIKLNKEYSDEISLIQIYYYDKLNKYKRIPEPLIPGIKYNFILPNKNISSQTNQNINIHTHSQFFPKNNEQSDIIGINANIKLISGKIKLYTDQCNTYPKCGINDNSRFLKEIYSIDGYFHTLIKSNSDTNSESNKQTLYKVVCEDEENDCKYQILFTDNQEKSFIRSGEKISKYLGPYQNILNSKIQDSYFTYLHSTGNKIVINLAVFSGDAYIVQINDIKGCKFDEEHFCSDERRIFHCNEDEMDEFFGINSLIQIKIEFSIRAGKNGAVYSLNIYEQIEENQEIYLPLEISKFEIISNDNNKFKILKKNEDSEVLSLIYPINCNINLNGNNVLYSKENNFIQFYSDLKERSFIDIILDKYNNNNINKCLFYISSYSYSKEDSFLIITENKPIQFKLNNKLNNIRLQYLYEISNSVKRIYLKSNIIGNSAIKIKIININEENTNEYIVKDNKIITIMNGNNNDIKGIPLNNISRLKIYIELFNKNNNTEKKENEVLVEFQIITDLYTPTFLKNGEQFSDILLGDKYKYFITLINKDSTGNYDINLNNEKLGNIYARLLDSDHIKEIGGWNNRFIFPNDTTDKNKLLPFDFENQKLIIQKEHTQFCNKYCYLLIGVKLFSNDKNIDSYNKLITRFNSYLEINNERKDSTEKENIFVNLKNNEYISSYVTDEENDYFSFKLNGYNSKLNITFNCDDCIITISFNDTNFTSKNEFISNEDKKIINFGEDMNIRNSIAYIKINTLNNENSKKYNNNIKYKYSLRLNSPNDIDDLFNFIDESFPETCEFTDKIAYYDYAIKLDNYNSEKDINIIAVPNYNNDDSNDGINKNIKNDIEIYANIVNDNETIESNSWPSKENHQFPQKGQNSSNFLIINKNDIQNEKKEKEDKIMLLRIYGKENNKINLYTNYEDIETLKEKDLLVPGKYQLITVKNTNSDSEFRINLPKNLDENKEYIYKIKKLDGKGKIIYGDNIYEINNKNDEITFPIDKSIPLEKNKIDIKNQDLKNNSFTFLIKYEEKNNFNSLEKAKIGGSKYFSLKDDSESIDYFIPLNNNINEDLPINIIFEELHSSEEDEYINEIRNNTETFDIEEYLINEDELNDIKNGNMSFMNDKKDFKYKGSYYLENKHGFLNINKKDIENFKKSYQNTAHYVYFTMKKSKINDRKYDNINGNINIYQYNNIQVSLPENDFYFNSLNCTKNNSHIYKLGNILKNQNDDISSDTHNLIIEFLSQIEGFKAKVIKDIQKKEEDRTYFNITLKENDNGKDLIIVSQNLDDVYLLVETPYKILNQTDDYKTNVDYMFKYSYERKDIDEEKKTKIEYKNTISYNKMKNTDLKTNITFNKVKDSSNKIIPCDYYIRIYKNNNNRKTNNFYPKKNVSLINNNDVKDIYAIFKIDYKSSLLKNEEEENLTVAIEIDTDEPVVVDVFAKNVQDGQIYGYSKGYPNSNDDFDIIDNDNGGNKGEENGNNGENDKQDDTKKGNEMSLIKFILIFICVLLLLILMVICCIKCCNCCGGKNDKLPGLKDITFNTNDDEEDNNITVSSYN